MHPCDMCSIGRKSDVAVQNSLAQLFRQLLHVLSCQCHGNETGQKKMLHIEILTNCVRSDKSTRDRERAQRLSQSRSTCTSSEYEFNQLASSNASVPNPRGNLSRLACDGRNAISIPH